MTRLSEVAIGDKLEVMDDGFTCMKKGELKIVSCYDDNLFIYCNDGMHFLSGQTKNLFSDTKGDDTLVGLEKVRSNVDADHKTVEET